MVHELNFMASDFWDQTKAMHDFPFNFFILETAYGELSELEKELCKLKKSENGPLSFLTVNWLIVAFYVALMVSVWNL